jgi:acetoin utilization protein AcuB
VLIKDILLPGLKTISVEATMVEAERILKEHNFRHLPVTDGRKLVGILSDRDIQRAMTVVFTSEKEKGDAHIQGHKKVSEYMSTPVHKMRNTDTVTRMVREMVNRKVSCFIIEDEDSSDIGIVTTEDLLILLLDLLEKEHGPVRALKKLFRLG